MLNEEFVEEMYWLAHSSEVYSEFQTNVTEELLKNPKISRYETIEKVFYKFVKEGKIEFKTSDVIL
jgi:hypothetical protein